MIKISPSILSADFSKLGEEIQEIDNAGADYIHIDVMDGSFVPNMTIGNEVVKSIRKCSNLTFDVHLMIDNPEKHIDNFAAAGSDIITIHLESTNKLQETISLIKSHNKKVGISIKPQTHEDSLDPIINQIDLILVMTVNPGFGGQKFMDSQLEKIRNIRHKIKKSGQNIELEVDGGINKETAKLVIEAGADVLVAGSYIFKSSNYSQAISSLKK
ncbi:MAG: ribulose-phosphate 3-epimerase [Rickettsiales bacterium]|nr:ribulose-phosphate 3-epimerase [Rickettsiales bacterium]